MDTMVVGLSIVAIAGMTVGAALVYRRMLPPSPSLRLTLTISATGSVVWFLFAALTRPDLPIATVILIAALAAFATFVATIVVRANGLPFAPSALFALGWSAMVFVPVAMLTFSGVGPFGVRPIDQGGSLAINVAAGAAALGVLVSTRPGSRRRGSSPLPVGVATVGVVILSLGWLGWLMGSELAFDELTTGIAVNGLAGAAGGVVGWLVVQRIRHQSTTLPAVAAGLVSGLVAVSAGSAMYEPFAAFVAAALASSAACIFTLGRVAHTARQQWFIVGSHLVAGTVGLIVLGLFANGFGFLFTGQYVVVRDQVISCVIVAAYSMGISVGLWFALRRIFRPVAVLERP